MKLNDYISGINGLRAIAAIAVLLSHATANWGVFKLGWVGVDLFFVISGFLITKILTDNRNSENYFRAFYLRRALRIFPIYFIVVIPLVVFHIYNNLVPAYVPISYLFYLQNSFAMEYGWLRGLAHTWTLAVEEQLYLILPVVIFILPRRHLFKTFIFVIAGVVILRFFFFIYHVPFNLQELFTIYRIDSFLIGGVAALLGKENFALTKERWNVIFNALIILSLLCLCFSIFYFGNSAYGFWNKILLGLDNFKAKSNVMSYWGHAKYTFLAIFFAALLAKISYQTSVFSMEMSRYLERPWLNKIGEMSYGIYLYHFVYVTIFRYFFHIDACDSALRILLIFVIIILTFGTAYLSFHYFEKPILKLRTTFK